VAAALAADEAGAGWIDIGGVPFSPDTPTVTVAEEIDRVLPVVERVAATSDIVVSVDTFRPEVATRCTAAGAAVINDTSGLHDPELADVVAAQGATVVITHSLALPRHHHHRPQYDDVVTEIKAFLAERIQLAIDHGIPESRIVIDPGHDLNKNTLHTLELTRRLAEVADLGLPMLAAVSNKDFVGEATGLAAPEPNASLNRRRDDLRAQRRQDPADARRHCLSGSGPHDRGCSGITAARLPAPQHELRTSPIAVGDGNYCVRHGGMAAGTGADIGPGPRLGRGSQRACRNANVARRRYGFQGALGILFGRPWSAVPDCCRPDLAPGVRLQLPEPESPVQARSCVAPPVE
jgi:dihydropteroate synthase